VKEVQHDRLAPDQESEPQLRVVPLVTGFAAPRDEAVVAFQQAQAVDGGAVEEAQADASIVLGGDVCPVSRDG
jgi:hypothetical protein